MNAHSFERLIGIWETSGTVFHKEGNLNISGIDRYEYVLARNYIKHKAEVMMGDQFSETIEMILLDVNPQKATLYYFNSEGEQGKMKGSIVEDQLKLESEQWRFEGSFYLNDTMIRGVWFIKDVNTENWIKLIEITLEKKS